MDPEGMHLGNPKTAKIFIKNFFTDFRAILGKKHIIKDFSKCDFEPIRKHLNEQKIIRKAITDEQRKANKEGRNQAMFQYGFSIVDGHIEKVGNYNMVGERSRLMQFNTWKVILKDSLCLLFRNRQGRFEAVVNIPRWEN